MTRDPTLKGAPRVGRDMLSLPRYREANFVAVHGTFLRSIQFPSAAGAATRRSRTDRLRGLTLALSNRFDPHEIKSYVDMRRTSWLIVAASLAMSCAGRANLEELDGLRNVYGPNGWKVYRGTQADFGESLPVCITGVDEGRDLDTTELIVHGVSQDLHGFVNVCDETRPRIRAEYQGDYSLCTHCGEPGLSTRFGTAFVRKESSTGRWLSDAIWTDTRGGPAEEVATRFARAFAGFLREARRSYRGCPPNCGIEWTWPRPSSAK